MIISRDLRELSETSIEILDFFIKFFSKTQKMLQFFSLSKPKTAYLRPFLSFLYHFPNFRNKVLYILDTNM